MKLPLLRIGIILGITFSLGARELFSPLELRRGPLNKPYTDISRIDSWIVNIWGGGYERSTQSAFNCTGYEVPLVTLFFNKAQFNLQEAFAGSSASTVFNPLLATSRVGPRVRYLESGAMIGFDVQQCFHECSRYGFRASIPVKKIQIKRCPSQGGNGMSDLGGETLDEFLAERVETVDGKTIKSFAYRLDLLSQLPYTCKPCPTASLPLVDYADTDFPPNNPISISKQDITNQSGTPVSALGSSTGRLPAGTWALPQERAQNLPPVAPNGTLASDRGRFDASIDYTNLGILPAQQATLFMVPTLEGTQPSQEARVIQAQVNEILACVAQEAEDVFKQCGISFDSQCTRGIGDLDTELYLGHFFSPCVYLEGYAGIRWPTGTQSKNPQRIFRQPLGNNGHYEMKAGAQGIWKPYEWAALRGDITGHAVLRSSECISASFTGAQIKNIGTPVRAELSWNYYLMHTDLLITPPDCHGLGAVVGYELYHKRGDHLRFCTSRALDCLGKNELLDRQVATKNTCITSHKVRGELFVELWHWLQIFAGGSSILSGRNVPKENSWYVGFNAYF